MNERSPIRSLMFILLLMLVVSASVVAQDDNMIEPLSLAMALFPVC
ncbi:MAG: hypothetical protein K8L99_09345 [Anaerolineae bacterium]|nr:hypothetical protein [Anaerolineae bacterium]